MPVRKTERRIPLGLNATDLGQASSSGDLHLISYLNSPIVDNRVQSYFVFVESQNLISTVSTYEWIFDNDGITFTDITSIGTINFTPQNLGNLSVTVNLKDSSNATIGNLSLQQNVIALNSSLEALIDATDNGFPAAAHPLTSREVINELRIFVDHFAPPASEDHLNRLLLAQITATTMQTNKGERNVELEEIAVLLDSGSHSTFLSQTENGMGVADVRPQLLAMLLDEPGVVPTAPYITLIEQRPGRANRATDQQAIAVNFNTLTEEKKIDLFNRLRFPRSNIAMCKLILDALLNKYYAGSTFENTLNDRTKATILITQLDIGLLTP